MEQLLLSARCCTNLQCYYRNQRQFCSSKNPEFSSSLFWPCSSQGFLLAPCFSPSPTACIIQLSFWDPTRTSPWARINVFSSQWLNNIFPVLPFLLACNVSLVLSHKATFFLLNPGTTPKGSLQLCCPTILKQNKTQNNPKAMKES